MVDNGRAVKLFLALNLLALRFALTDAGWLPVAACLGCALLAHIADLQRRLITDRRT